MNNIKRIVITSALIVFLSSGVTYSLCKTKTVLLNRQLKKYQSDNDDLLICAHRGYSSLEVENTFQAINLAAKEKYIDFIEVDARMTKDGEIVLSHNNVIFDQDYLPIIVSNITYDEAITTDFMYKTVTSPNYFWYDDEKLMINNRLQKLNNQNYNLIGLSDGIKACSDKKIIIDLKFHDDIVEFTDKLKQSISNSSNIIFQSFDIQGIKYLQDNSDFDCMLLVDNKKDLEYVKYFKRVAIEQSLITYDLIKELIDNDITVAIWTINGSEQLVKVLYEVKDYYKNIIYITNYPDLILMRIKERQLVKKI